MHTEGNTSCCLAGNARLSLLATDSFDSAHSHTLQSSHVMRDRVYLCLGHISCVVFCYLCTFVHHFAGQALALVIHCIL